MALILGSLCWGLAYFFMIKQSLRDKAIAYPLFCNMVNWSWEFTYSFVKPSTFFLSLLSNYIWFILNSIILICFFRFTKRNKFRCLIECIIIYSVFYFLVFKLGPVFVIEGVGTFNFLILTGFLFAIIYVLGVMYQLFINKTIKGQSNYIALSTLLGTTFYSIEVAYNPVHSVLLNNMLYFFMIVPIILMLVYTYKLVKYESVISV